MIYVLVMSGGIIVDIEILKRQIKLNEEKIENLLKEKDILNNTISDKNSDTNELKKISVVGLSTAVSSAAVAVVSCIVSFVSPSLTMGLLLGVSLVGLTSSCTTSIICDRKIKKNNKLSVDSSKQIGEIEQKIECLRAENIELKIKLTEKFDEVLNEDKELKGTQEKKKVAKKTTKSKGR